jgi:hypothetical protein
MGEGIIPSRTTELDFLLQRRRHRDAAVCGLVHRRHTPVRLDDGRGAAVSAHPAPPGAEGLVRIATDATVFGTFVYAMDATHTPLDAPTAVYGFFVPSMSMDVGHQVVFPSVILTGDVGGLLPPGVPAQQIEQAIAVQCEGSRVVF